MVTIYEYYITPAEYEIAKNNGISYSQLNQRVRVSQWNKDKAINTPVRKKRKATQENIEIAKKIGVSTSLLYQRMTKGMTEYEAATTPIMSPHGNFYYTRGVKE